MSVHCNNEPREEPEEILNPSGNNKILVMSKLKAFADDKMNVAKKMILFFHRTKNTVEQELRRMQLIHPKELVSEMCEKLPPPRPCHSNYTIQKVKFLNTVK